jgi:hypothetical protein
LQKAKNKHQPTIPTVDVFLQYKPQRLDYEWCINEKGLVHIKVPKFRSNFGKSFCKLIRKENMFTANLNELGSLVWQHCDGKKTVKQILQVLKKNYPDEKNIDQRLFLYLQQLKNLNYIDF